MSRQRAPRPSTTAASGSGTYDELMNQLKRIETKGTIDMNDDGTSSKQHQPLIATKSLLRTPLADTPDAFIGVDNTPISNTESNKVLLSSTAPSSSSKRINNNSMKVTLSTIKSASKTPSNLFRSEEQLFEARNLIDSLKTKNDTVMNKHVLPLHLQQFKLEYNSLQMPSKTLKELEEDKAREAERHRVLMEQNEKFNVESIINNINTSNVYTKLKKINSKKAPIELKNEMIEQIMSENRGDFNKKYAVMVDESKNDNTNTSHNDNANVALSYQNSDYFTKINENIKRRAERDIAIGESVKKSSGGNAAAGRDNKDDSLLVYSQETKEKSPELIKQVSNRDNGSNTPSISPMKPALLSTQPHFKVPELIRSSSSNLVDFLDDKTNSKSKVVLNSNFKLNKLVPELMTTKVINLDKANSPVVPRHLSPHELLDLNDVMTTDTLVDSYAPVILTTANAATKVSENFEKVLSDYSDEVKQSKIMKKKSGKMFDFIRTSSYEDLSIDLDPNFTKRRLYSKGLYLIIFYVNKFKSKSAIERLKVQTAEASKCRIIRAGHELTRIARGFLGRLHMRDEIRRMNERIDLEKQRIQNQKLYVNKMAIRIKNFIFYTGKMRTIRKHIRRKNCAIVIQKRARGILGRVYFKKVLDKFILDNLCATSIQCAYRCHLARRWVKLLKKVKVVDDLFAGIDAVEEEKKDWKQIHGAAFVLTRYVRKFIVNRHVRKMIYWHRIECAITIQKYYRRYIARVKYIKVIRAMRAESSVYLMAVTVIQKCIRGRLDRKLVTMLKDRRVKEKQQRLLRKKELLKWGSMYPPRIVRSALRSLVPFRYTFEWRQAQKIQRFWRGYRYGRRRLYFARIREHIRKYQVRLRIRANGILKFQALFRGYRYRYGVMRKTRVAKAVLIQCFFRVQRARYELKTMKLQRRAAEVLGKNCRILIKWRKTKKAREERNKFDRFVRKIQICARKFLGRQLLSRLKNAKRIALENKLSTEDSLNRLMGLIQLRIIQDSITCNLGQKNPVNKSGVACPCLGPVQALFCIAVGPKARYTTDYRNLITNKLDNNNYRQFVLSHNGLTIHGRGSQLADKNQANKNKAKRKGKVLAFSKYAKLFYCIFKGYFRLYNYEKKASPNDVELAFSSARFSAESGQLLTYFEFLECCRILGCKVFDKDGMVKSLRVLEDYNYEFSQNSGHDDIDDYNEQRLNSLMNVRPVNTRFSNKDTHHDASAVDGKSDNENNKVKSGNGSSIVDTLDQHAIATFVPKRTVKKTINNIWPVRRLMIHHPDYIRKSDVLDPKLTLILKMFITSIDDDWMTEVMDYLDKETAARLSTFVLKIQNLVRRRRAQKIKHVMRLNKDTMKVKGERYLRATQIQSLVRLFLARRRSAHKAQKHFIHYIPIDRDDYWFNPRTRVNHQKKPRTLLHYDSVSVLLPAKGQDFIILCFFCSVQHATVNCVECEESYCKRCFDDMHCKGSRNRHMSYRIPFCSNCRYQHATKSCLSCILQKPKVGSLQETMSESERGTLCDTCFDHLHNASEHVLKKEALRKERVLLSRVQTPLIVSQQIRSRVMTSHKFESLVQPCDECEHRSAFWRCDDCEGQVYCHVCLIGLHSMGPFVLHKAATLSYYTPEGHKNYRDDSISHRRYNKFEAMKRYNKKQRDTFYQKSVLRIQTWWRRIFHGRKGRAQMKAVRRQQRRLRAVYIRETIEKRNTLTYQLLDIFGSAPALRSDSREDKILKCVSPFSRRRAREHIWQNKEDWAWYLDKQEAEAEALAAERKEKEKREKKSQKFKAADGEVVDTEEDIEQRLLEDQEREVSRLRKRRKGDVLKGFDIRAHKDKDLVEQAKFGGFRLPGAVACKYAKGQFKTSRNLTYFIKRGQLVRIGHQLFRVIAVTMRAVTLDRRWRGEDGKHIIYRLPHHPSERGRWTYYFKYKSFDYIVRNQAAQTYFGIHAAVMSRIENAAKSIASVHKRFDFMIGYTNWMATAKKFRMRSKWAQSFLGEGKAVAFRDPDAVTIFKVINQATGVDIAKFIPVQDDENVDDEGREEVDPVTAAYVNKLHNEGGVSREDLSMSNLEYYNMMMAIARRPKGGNWYGTKLELMVRNKREGEMDPQELALQADTWEENVDIMTENIYYIHKETREMLNEVPLALATKIRLEEQEREARDRDNAIKSVTKQFLKKKGGNSMKKR